MPPRVTTSRQLFAKGQVTDTDTADLTPDQAEALRDVVWTANGDLAKRGGFLYASGANPMDGRTAKLTSAVLLPDENTSPQTYTLVFGEYFGRVAGLVSYQYTPGSANAAVTSTNPVTLLNGGNFGSPFPLLAYQGEVIIAAIGHDMVSSSNRASSQLFRWAGATGSLTASPAGTVTVTSGDDVVTGTGTAFTTDGALNRYIAIEESVGIFNYYRVVEIGSDTRLRVASPIPVAYTTADYVFTNVGVFNIASLVTTKGRATTSAGTATGQATTWNSGLDAVRGQNDWISDEAGAVRAFISVVSSDTSMSSGSLSLTNARFRVGRTLSGSMVTLHQNRLWVTGLPWAPNRLQVTPAGFNLGDHFNGVDSSTTAPGLATVVESVEIPSPFAPGRIVALEAGNDPGPLLVLRDTDAYIVYGEWPSIQVTKLGDNIGCLARGASCRSEDGFFWAGSDGIYQYRPGGGVRDLTEGKVNREWRAHVKSITGYAAWDVNMEVVDSTLVISSQYGNDRYSASAPIPPGTFPATQYAYDIDRGAWGTWTGPNVNSMTTMFYGDKPREVIATDYSTNRLITLSGALDPTLAGQANGVNGTFLARSGRMLMGSAGDLGRVIDSRVTYRMTGSSPQFTVKYGSTSLNTAATVTTTTSGTAYATTRVKPGSTNLGTAGRDMQVEFAESSGTPTRLEINEFSWVTRERRKRA